jgi:hypothetical protein
MKLPNGSMLSITSFLAAYVRGSCSMSDPEHARLMLRIVEKDHTASVVENGDMAK